MLQRLVALALLPLSVYSLSCYICGDSNLDEFGECSTQFQYDCQSYAARFPQDETIFCRTTRQKAPNNTYTIMKECISEQDHYRTFPNKGYSIDEECDLVDVNGDEVAYCLCRSQSFCNKAPIADQFIAFEEKNPELFGDIEQTTRPGIPKGPAPLGLPVPQQTPLGFGAPPVPPPPIIPINDPRSLAITPGGIEPEIRRAQLPTRERPGDGDDSPSGGGGTIPLSENLNVDRSSVGQGRFIGSMGVKHHAVAVAAPPSAPQLPLSLATNVEQSSTGLKCMQCGQTDLRSADADCDRQVLVRCHDPDAVCFTRQILLGGGQAAVEKMCVSWQAVKQEFPTSSMDSCGNANDGRVRFCTCTDDECNSVAISLQIAKDFPTDPLPPFVRTHPAGPFPHLAAPELPVPELPPHVIAAVPSIHPVPKEFPSKIASSSEENRERSEQRERLGPTPPPIEPIVHRGSKTEIPSEPLSLGDRTEPRAPAETEQRNRVEASQKPTLRCSACLETGITDPTADCSTSAPASCSPHETYCLTRQTQSEEATFTMEKRCISETMVEQFTKSDDVSVGCGIADGGMINFCICKQDLCNHDSILAQAQISGVRKPESAVKPIVPKPQQVPKVDPPKPPPPNVPPVFLENDEAPSAEEAPAPETRLNSEERELLERQKQWAEADLTASVASSALSSLLFIGVLFL